MKFQSLNYLYDSIYKLNFEIIGNYAIYYVNYANYAALFILEILRPK